MNVFGPAPNSAERDAEAHATPYEWTNDVKTANQAVAKLQQYAASGKPFFLGVGFYKPHVPLVCPQRFFDLYAPTRMPLPMDFAPTPTARRHTALCAAIQYRLVLPGMGDTSACPGGHRRVLRLCLVYG